MLHPNIVSLKEVFIRQLPSTLKTYKNIDIKDV